MSELKVGELVICQPNGVMEKEFTGRVQKIYENSAFVMILEYDDCDDEHAYDLVYRTVIAKKNIQKAIDKFHQVHKCPEIDVEARVIS